MILLDTHVLIWSRFGGGPIGAHTRHLIEQAVRHAELAVSAFTFWEVSMLQEKRRINLVSDVGSWRDTLLSQGLIEIPVDGEIGIRANELPDFHADPADRIIVATAMNGHELVTADRRILDWSGELRCVDAAR